MILIIKECSNMKTKLKKAILFAAIIMSIGTTISANAFRFSCASDVPNLPCGGIKFSIFGMDGDEAQATAQTPKLGEVQCTFTTTEKPIGCWLTYKTAGAICVCNVGVN